MQRISDLLDAKIEVAEIMDIVKCSRSLIFKAVKLKKDGKDLSRKEGSGVHNLKRDSEFLGDLKKKIKEDPTKSMNRLSNEFDIDEGTIRRTVKEDLGLSSYTRTLLHLLKDTLKERRLQRCKKVRVWIKANGSIVKNFSDEKIFTVDQVYNTQNDCWHGRSPEEVKGVFRTKHPSQTMVRHPTARRCIPSI
uniref:Uncharacterized protein n=1 Tax=Lepeophtheirus salmonis TaxID=72036 RepID=A0A0K2SX77_LEPSM